MAKASGLINGVSGSHTKYDPSHVYDVKVSETWVDHRWNTRVDVATTNPDSQEGEASYYDNVVSIAKEGQRTPCCVRPNPFKGKKGHPGERYEYMLVEGFGRVRARSELAAGEHGVLLGKSGFTQADADALKTKEPTFRTFIIPMTEAEARRRNLGENMLRAQLTAPDIAFGVYKLAEAEPQASNVELGKMIGRSDAYVAKLRRIYSTFKDVQVPADALWKGSPAMPVTEAWRCAPKKALNEDMLKVADADAKDPLSPKEKLDGYLMACGLKEDPNAKKKNKVGANAYIANSQEAARAFGVLLGNLERDGGIEILDLTGEHWAIFASKYAGKASKMNDDLKDAILTACLAGVAEGRKKAAKKAAKKEDGAKEDGASKKVPKAAASKPAAKKAAKGKGKASAHA